MDPRKQEGVAEFGRRPFTIVVADEATRAGGFAFDEAARVAERIPLSALHAVYLVKRGTSLAQMEQIAASLRADTVGRAAALGLHDRLMAVHVRSGDPATEIAAVARELGADMVVLGESERRFGARRTNAIFDRLHIELECPVVLAKALPSPQPEIEPPCPACALARVQSHGQIWWCAAHRTHRHAAHHYSYRREHALAQHDSNVIPTGIAF
jgi:nucleotide-binding universal stress UspA family protein